jgi:pimeloyl-ACP methyl ester carboxylesterase
MTAGGLRYDRFLANGRPEWLALVGGEDAPTLLFLPPLLEELNRTRALLFEVMRRLAAEGWRCALPDLPGTGESETRLAAVEWRHWRDAAIAACEAVGAAAIVSVRGGALLDDCGQRRWRLAPADGAALARDLERTGLVGAAGGGYAPSPALLGALRAAVPAGGAVRTMRLASDPAPADVKVDAPPLWRRSEPAASPALAAAMAADVAAWMAPCAAS